MSKLTPITPKGGRFGELKASISFVLSLVDLFPLISLLWKKIVTSGMLKWPATIREPKRLSTASFFNSKIGIYDPVSITVLFKFSSINDSAEAV